MNKRHSSFAHEIASLKRSYHLEKRAASLKGEVSSVASGTCCAACGLDCSIVPKERTVCPTCRSVQYCSHQCLNWDWLKGGHKVECPRRPTPKQLGFLKFQERSDRISVFSGTSCNACGIECCLDEKNRTLCQGCKKVHYCNFICQEWDWEKGGHATECQGIKTRRRPQNFQQQSLQILAGSDRQGSRVSGMEDESLFSEYTYETVSEGSNPAVTQAHEAAAVHGTKKEDDVFSEYSIETENSSHPHVKSYSDETAEDSVDQTSEFRGSYEDETSEEEGVGDDDDSFHDEAKGILDEIMAPILTRPRRTYSDSSSQTAVISNLFSSHPKKPQHDQDHNNRNETHHSGMDSADDTSVENFDQSSTESGHFVFLSKNSTVSELSFDIPSTNKVSPKKTFRPPQQLGHEYDQPAVAVERGVRASNDYSIPERVRPAAVSKLTTTELSFNEDKTTSKNSRLPDNFKPVVSSTSKQSTFKYRQATATGGGTLVSELTLDHALLDFSGHVHKTAIDQVKLDASVSGHSSYEGSANVANIVHAQEDEEIGSNYDHYTSGSHDPTHKSSTQSTSQGSHHTIEDEDEMPVLSSSNCVLLRSFLLWGCRSGLFVSALVGFIGGVFATLGCRSGLCRAVGGGFLAGVLVVLVIIFVMCTVTTDDPTSIHETDDVELASLLSDKEKLIVVDSR